MVFETIDILVLRFLIIISWTIGIFFQELRIRRIKKENKKLKIETPGFIWNARILQLFLGIFLVQEVAFFLVFLGPGWFLPHIELVCRTLAAALIVVFLKPRKGPLLRPL